MIVKRKEAGKKLWPAVIAKAFSLHYAANLPIKDPALMKYPQGRPTYFGNIPSRNREDQNHAAIEYKQLRELIAQDCASEAAYAVIDRIHDCAVAFSIFEKKAFGCEAFDYHLLPAQENLREIVMQGKGAMVHLQARVCVKLEPTTGELLGSYAVHLNINDH